jgi:hypothetical protein
MPPTFRDRNPFEDRPSSSILSAAWDRATEHTFVLRATGQLDGPPVAPADGVEWLARQAYELVTDDYDCVLALTGKEGVSKSILALRLCLAIGRLSSVPWDLKRLCYTARELLVAYRDALAARERYRTIWFDESVRGLLAGETFDPDQVAITKAMYQNRAVGAILIICVPDIRALAKKIRGRRATFWVHVENRGTWRRPAPSVGRVHERDERIPYVASDALGLATSKRCPRLTYEPFDEKDPEYVAYKVEKFRRLGDFFDEEIAEMDVRDARRRAKKARVPSRAPM